MTYISERAGFSLKAQTLSLGSDLCVVVTGGAAHLGSVSIATPRPRLADPAVTSATVSTFCYPGHKDDKIGNLFAETLSARLVKKVTVLCGIHYDNITPQGIAAVGELARDLLQQMLQDPELSVTDMP